MSRYSASVCRERRAIQRLEIETVEIETSVDSVLSGQHRTGEAPQVLMT
jgi:hypothetical protein